MTHAAGAPRAESADATSTTPPSDRGGGGFRGALKGLLPGMLLDVGLPLVTYYVLTGVGMASIPALVLSGLWPLLSIAVTVARRHRIDGFAVFIIVGIVLGAATSVLFHDARYVLLKDSLLTGGIGIFFLLSMLAPRPIMFYFGRKFGTDGSVEGLARWDGYWTDNAVFRHGQRLMTVVWGAAFVVEAIVRVLLGLVVPLDVMVGISNIMPFCFIVVLIFWTITYVKRNTLASKRAAQAARAEQPT